MTDFSAQPRPDFSRLRIDYMQRSLDEKDADQDPIVQFTLWLNQAIAAAAHEPNAMTLATCTRDGVPSARIVLLKGVDERGLVFFTNYLSRKGRELDDNARAATVFYWPELERQVRVEGQASRTSASESADYFNSRPTDARYGSAVSPQSQPIASRRELEQRVQALRDRYPDGDVPCPPHWGGYRLRPTRMEFWQGRASRVHDRIEYLRGGEGQWTRRRLAP
ncbi:MAG TPA: pyridoxamine 5'-phosphate oxidase [Tepidisphaeraceae bacterium]|jgi:pyridoxamine 5'-phosphate oxidase|nr:pyridoxamine 5'-phosphate oxidase [Tepidisphaeraceae bacterium]